MTCARTYWHDRRAFKKRACDQLFRLGAHQTEQLFVNRIHLGDDDEAGLDCEEAADVEMFARLRHDAFVRRNDERNQINPVRARQHVLDEALVAVYVHEADTDIAQIQLREPQINRDPAPLLLRQTISVDAPQSAHHRSLPMIYVPGSADDDGTHRRWGWGMGVRG